MSEHIVSVLISTPKPDALTASAWLEEQEVLPRALITLATSFRFAVGEKWVWDALQESREALTDKDPEGQS